MNIKLAAPLVLLLLAACDGNPLGTGDPEVPVCDTNCPVGADDPVTLPTVLAKNLKAIAYDQASDSFRITYSSLDTTPTVATWNRRAALDTVGYRAYTVQEDALDRMFVGLAKTSTDGSVTAIAAGDGGQFNRVFQGGSYARNGGWSAPAGTSAGGSGQVSYAGTYAGVTNIRAPRPGEILPVPGGTAGEVIPGQPSRVQGDIFINANFTDNAVNGAIYNRVLVDYTFGLQAVILVPTDIEANGSFTGTTERWVNDDSSMAVTGDYGGVFGGTGATAVGGLVALTKLYRSDDGTALTGALEQGVFVLQQCGTPGDAAICGQVAPTNP
jgi:hypothetical protein